MKTKIITGVKIRLLVFMTSFGFLFAYCFVWFLMDLPATKWAGLLLAILSGLSSSGLFYWIGKGE